MEKLIASITVAKDGFLWFRGAKIQARLVPGGIEFHEKDPRRAEKCGGALFVVPFEAILELCVAAAERKNGKA